MAFCLTCSDWQVNIAPLSAKIDNMMVSSIGPDPDDILKQDEPFILSLDVTLSGPGAAALLPLAMPITVSFYAESYGPGPEVALGSSTIKTAPGVHTYTVKVNVPAGTLSAERVYKIAATVRVGAPGYPALVNGFSEGGAIEIYNP